MQKDFLANRLIGNNSFLKDRNQQTKGKCIITTKYEHVVSVNVCYQIYF